LESNKVGKELAQSLFLGCLHIPVTKVTISYKACATIDFGKDLIVKVKTNKGMDQFTRGEWSFWLYACSWRLDLNGKPKIGSSDSEEGIKETLPILEGKRLLKVDILNSAFDLVLHFEDNWVLSVFSCETEDPEPWSLSTPDEMVFSAKANDKWEYKKSGLS